MKRGKSATFLCIIRLPLSTAHDLSLRHNQTYLRLETIAMTHNIFSKLAQLFCGGVLTAWRTCLLPFTHGEIGRCIGATCETVTRTLGSFQRRRDCTYEQSVLTIRDCSRSSVLSPSERLITCSYKYGIYCSLPAEDDAPMTTSKPRSLSNRFSTAMV